MKLVRQEKSPRSIPRTTFWKGVNIIETKTAFHLAIIGLGYVGLPLARLFLENGQTVYGIDVDERKIEKLSKRQSYLSDFSAGDIRKMFYRDRFHAGSSYDAVSNADAIIICVPTPLDASNDPDLSYVKSAVENMLPYIRKGHLIVLESSTYPGTTEEELLPMIESTGFKVGRDVYLAYSPERIDPGQKRMELSEIPKVVGGVTEACTNYAKRIYETAFHRIVVVSSPRVAEMTKNLENCQRMVNISFMNELVMLSEKMNVNLWEAIEAASTKPYGFTPYYPGPGIGGHCIPVVPLHLFWRAKEYGHHLQFIDVAKRVNDQIPHFVVEKTKRLLERNKPLTESSVFVLGVTYKKDVNDIRESKALTIIEKLKDLGVEVHFHDPYIKEITVSGTRLKCCALTKKYVSRHDCTLILTDHSNIPYESVVKYSPLVIDTRNVTGPFAKNDNVVLL